MEKDKVIERLAIVEQQSKSNTKRLDEHNEKLEELSNVYIALTQTNDKVNNIETDVKDIKTDIKDIKDKPRKRLEKIIDCIISALVGGIITFMLVRLGMK